MEVKRLNIVWVDILKQQELNSESDFTSHRSHAVRVLHLTLALQSVTLSTRRSLGLHVKSVL